MTELSQKDAFRITNLMDRWEFVANDLFTLTQSVCENGRLTFALNNDTLDLHAYGPTIKDAFEDLDSEMEYAWEVYVEEASKNPEKFDSHAITYGKLLKESVRRLGDGLAEKE